MAKPKLGKAKTKQQKALLYWKGINTKTSDILMAEDELKVAVNVDLSKYGIIQKRAGYVQRGDQITASNNILGLLQYYSSGGISQLIAACNDSTDTNLKIVARTQQNYSWTVTTVAKPNAKVEGVNFIDYLFLVGYDSAGDAFIDTLCWNGTISSTATNLTNAPNGKFAVLVNGYLLIMNGQDESSNRSTSRVWWPDPPTTLPLALTWDNTNNWWDFEPHNGEEITGGIANFNRAIIFKNTSTHIFDPVGQDAKMISNSIGCDSHRSIQNVGGFTVFYNRKGVYVTNGSDIQLISNPVEKFIDAINQDNIYDICAGVKDNRYYHLFIGDVTVDEDSYTNCELIYDTTQNSWTVNELANVVTVYCNYIQPTETTSTSTSSSSSSQTTSSSSSSSHSTSSSSHSSSSISSSSSSITTSSISSSTSSATSSSQSTSSSSSSSL